MAQPPTPSELKKQMQDQLAALKTSLEEQAFQKAIAEKKEQLEIKHQAVRSAREAKAIALGVELHRIIDEDRKRGRTGFDNFYSAYATIAMICEALAKYLDASPVTGARLSWNGNTLPSLRDLLNSGLDQWLIKREVAKPTVPLPDMEYVVGLNAENQVAIEEIARKDGQLLTQMDFPEEPGSFEGRFRHALDLGIEAWLLQNNYGLDKDKTIKHLSAEGLLEGEPIKAEEFMRLRDDPVKGLDAFLNPPDRLLNLTAMPVYASQTLRP